MKTVLRLNGESWEFDENEIDLTDAFKIKAASGLTVPQMLAGVAEMDPLAMQTLVWFAKEKAGQSCSLASINFKLLDLEIDQPEEPEGIGKDPFPESESTA